MVAAEPLQLWPTALSFLAETDSGLFALDLRQMLCFKNAEHF
jgi:hypothetical protein